MLDFEHLIEVSALDRDDLWAGLVYRARRPDHFNPALCCRIEHIDEQQFIRYIQVGELELRDEVRLIPCEEVRTLIDGRYQPMHAESLTRIEETASGVLCVRFSYRRDSITDQGGIQADEYLKSAYQQMDRAAIAQIQQLAAEGWSKTLM